MGVIGAVVFVGFVMLACGLLALFGVVLGPVLWLIVYALFRGLCALGLHRTDPDRASLLP
jgi:hypothetical protein